MPRTIESQRQGRATEGHPYRLQMIAWNKGELGKAAQIKHKQTDRYKKKMKQEKKVGGKLYEHMKTVRVASRKTAAKSGQFWTVEQVEELEELIRAGYTCKEIGLALQRSLQSIERKKARLKKEKNEPN
jgi:hypothetical protein